MHNHAAGNKPAIQDEEQQRVIRATGGEFLTLAPPGCGKTHVLAERIRYAHAAGVNYGDMLCLTFTNRAARGMMERIRTAISDHDIDEVYVGNIHRFCSRFLLENSLVPAETGIIDDEDVLSIMSQFIGLDEDVVAANRETRQRCYAAVHLAGFMRQIEHIHPKELRIHPECLTRGDIEALELICKVQRMTFTPAVMALIYHGADDFADIVKGDAYPAGCQQLLAAMLGKMSLARQYDEYKRDNRLIDFEDLLLLTYDALKEERDVVRGGGQGTYRHYTWCQVDEVQDLNPLQLAIIDLLMSADGADGHDPADRTMMYLGDEQQAIFSFMGAKVNTLERLKERCDGHIFRLTTNHRSPEYLLDVFNTYASEVLHIDPALLPETDWQPVRTGNELCYYRVPTLREEFTDAAQQARRLSEEDSGATTAVIVLTNNDADTISGRMDEMNIRHFKVSGTDLFSSPAVKLLIAHLAIFANEHNFIAWSRLLKGLHVYERNTSARDFVRQLTEHALTPADLMLRPGSSYVKAFARVFNEEEIVVFDTETTGLNVLEDDIVQIAAVRIRRGQIVDDSAFCVYIETEREIPKMLGDVVNPIIEERKNQHPLQHDEALRRFADYVDADILLGHNADFDYNILDANLRRYLPDYDLRAHAPIYFDTLKLTRLLVPHLR
ncbi:MAG: UvrD-helicase domain-containing protein [Prevotella sp.]|nr:UvrD-helicase domain-containing protein [Prevotella sp.]